MRRASRRRRSAARRDRHDHRADVAAGDVGADGEAPPLGWELLGEEAVPDRMLRRATDAGDDVREANAGKDWVTAWARTPRRRAGRRREDRPPGDPPCQRSVSRLDHPDAKAPSAARNGIVSILTLKSATI